MKTIEAEKIRLDKQKEAEQLFKKLGIEEKSKTEIFGFGIDKFVSNKDDNKKTKLHWTRLSINSNATHTID
ncbi:hypothetical protein EG339_19745 [Chryseobacterium bernardetii]|uniref:Uncharacterized protein n=1 Tax=Chryseobacterium bernardetii TaxID=1241978 RepID=A0A3G6TBR2_9FLAO|nr:hypothetical protein [Chryseobacterium bernardetii]AZB26661.1 hypothetical protein EG339_19745 [Chryseobacterium bernardetii]